MLTSQPQRAMSPTKGTTTMQALQQSTEMYLSKHPRLDDGASSKHDGRHIVVTHVMIECGVIPDITVAQDGNGRVLGEAADVIPVGLLHTRTQTDERAREESCPASYEQPPHQHAPLCTAVHENDHAE
jgi:hypothetical protein